MTPTRYQLQERINQLETQVTAYENLVIDAQTAQGCAEIGFNDLFEDVKEMTKCFKRLDQVNRGQPDKATHIASFLCKNPYDVEAELHKMFDAQRVLGTEWFDLDFDQSEMAMKTIEEKSLHETWVDQKCVNLMMEAVKDES